MQRFYNLLKFLIPHYIKEGKTSLTVGIGCTGGRHRSVTLANKLAYLLDHDGYNVNKRHRDIEKDSPGV